MTEPAIDRRLLLGGLALAGASGAAAVQAQPAAAPAAGAFTPQALPFDPKAVPGLSEKLLTSHHDNNYAGAVRRLGAIRAEFAKLDPATAQGFQINGLKREELIAWNSMILHEVYFAGLAGGVAPSRELAAAIERDFGSQQKWAAEFAGIGKALGGGSGWVVLTWSPHDRRLVNTWAADHTMTLAGGTPLLVLDMYEHAYQMDYGARAAAYVDAVMKVLSFGRANEVFRRAAG
jgi:Fe-Mn family superoxide dismutase